MSTHGKVPPRASRGCGPVPRQRRSVLVLVADVLAREAAVGAALWAGAFLPGAAATSCWIAVLAVTVAGSYLYGVTRSKAWQSVVGEAALLYAGGMCVAALLTRAIAMPPWLAGF